MSRQEKINKLKQAIVENRKKYGTQVIVIKEVVPENVVIVPMPDHVIKDSDILVCVGKDEDFQKFLKIKQI